MARPCKNDALKAFAKTGVGTPDRREGGPGLDREEGPQGGSLGSA